MLKEKKEKKEKIKLEESNKIEEMIQRKESLNLSKNGSLGNLNSSTKPQITSNIGFNTKNKITDKISFYDKNPPNLIPVSLIKKDTPIAIHKKELGMNRSFQISEEENKKDSNENMRKHNNTSARSIPRQTRETLSKMDSSIHKSNNDFTILSHYNESDNLFDKVLNQVKKKNTKRKKSKKGSSFISNNDSQADIYNLNISNFNDINTSTTKQKSIVDDILDESYANKKKLEFAKKKPNSSFLDNEFYTQSVPKTNKSKNIDKLGFQINQDKSFTNEVDFILANHSLYRGEIENKDLSKEYI